MAANDVPVATYSRVDTELLSWTGLVLSVALTGHTAAVAPGLCLLRSLRSRDAATSLSAREGHSHCPTTLSVCDVLLLCLRVQSRPSRGQSQRVAPAGLGHQDSRLEAGPSGSNVRRSKVSCTGFIMDSGALCCWCGPLHLCGNSWILTRVSFASQRYGLALSPCKQPP